MNLTANRGQLKQIVIPKQLQSLAASNQMRSQSIQLDKTNSKAPRSKSQIQIQKRQELPRIQAEKLDQEAYNTGIAIKLLPVDYYIEKTKSSDDFLKVVDQVEQELTNVYNNKNELISGQALTQFWSTIDQKKEDLAWVNCEVLAKIDSDKFLVFINDEHVYKVVSNANIIFKSATMQQMGSTETHTEAEPLKISFTDLLRRQEKPDTNEYLIKIFNQQRQNLQLQKRFKDAVADFGKLSINLAAEQLKKSADLSTFAVICLNSRAGMAAIRGMHGAGNATGETQPVATQDQVEKLKQAEKQRIFQCTGLHAAAVAEKSPVISSATILCTDAISQIDFNKLLYRITNAETLQKIDECCLGSTAVWQNVDLGIKKSGDAQNTAENSALNIKQPQQILEKPGPTIEQLELKSRVCTQFLQHAQLTDSQLQVLSSAYEDEKHQLHWCASYLALFLWSSYRFYQLQGYFRDYCYGPGGAALTDEGRAVMERHRAEVEMVRGVVGRHLAAMQNPKFQLLAQCVYKTYADHRTEILFGALKVIPTLWQRFPPRVSGYLLGGMGGDSDAIPGDAAGVFVDFGCSVDVPFRTTFYEKLINAHKLVYQLIAPHLVDQIVNDFAGTVINSINTKLFQYQSQHGKQPSIALQDEYTKQSYTEALKLFKQIFKVIEIKYLNLFVDDLYNIAVPQWFYFLLAILHGYSRNRDETKFQKEISGQGQQTQTGTELMKLINLTPNTQSFHENVFQDIDSLNTQSDFELPKSKQLINATLDALSQIEFSLVPIQGDNFVEGLKIVPDPLTISSDLEKCVEDLSIYYSSSPKFVNSLVYDYHSSAAHNSYTIEQREYAINPKEITYRDYLQLIYTGQQLTDNANQNPFNLNFESEQVQAQLKEKAESRREKRLHQNQDIIDKVTDDDVQREIEADEKQLRTETKFTEVTYYYSSRLIKKMVKISKLAGDKLKKYFDVFIRYFSLHIKKTQTYVERLFDKNKLFPPEIAMQLNGYDELLVHVDLDKFLKQKMQAEERARHKLKQLTQFMQMNAIHQMFTKIYIIGEGPQQIIIDILNTTVDETLKTLQNIYENVYQIMSLPGRCYYSTAHINITQLLICLQQTDRLLFDFYSERLYDYISLIISVLCDNLSQITRNLNVVYFENMNQIGELYKMYKLFMQNKDTWMNVFNMINDKLQTYEKIPMGSLSSKYYDQMLEGYIKLRKEYRDTYTEMQRITSKVVTAFNISKSFISSVQTYFELIINNEIYNRAHEYIKLSQDDWENIAQDQIGFSKKFPLINKDIQFPKPVKLTEENNNVVDFKQLRKDIEAKFGYNIFTVIQKQIKIRIFERTEQNFKRQAMSEVFYELEDLIDKTIITLQYLNDLQVQLLYVQPNQQIQFDKIDEMIFNNQQSMDQFVKQLQYHGEVVIPNKQNIDQIIDNMDIQGTTQLSRLKSLHIVFKLLSQLIVMATNFQQQFQIWKKQSISLLYADDVRNNVIDQIKVCLKTLEYFQPIKHRIASFAQNLIDFMVQERKNLIQMFILKASIYESSIKTVESQDDEVVKRPQIDQLIKIDIKDFAVSSGFMKQIFQYKNIKQSDDILTSTLLEQMGDQKANMYLHISDCQKMVRFEKLQQHYNSILSKMVQQPADYGIFTSDFKIIKLNHLSTLTINDYVKTEQIKSALGDEPGYIQQYYDVYYYQDDFSSQLPFINIAQNQKHINYTGNQKMYHFLLEHIEFIMRQVELQTINVQHGYQLIGQLSCMKQFYQLLAECYRYIQNITMLNDLATHCKSSAFTLRQLTASEQQQFTNEIENLKVHISTCFTTYSNASQYVSRRLNREKLYDSVCALKQLYNNLFSIESGYYNSQGVPREQIIQLLLELTYYGIFATPVVQSQKFYNGCLIFWPPDEVNESLSALLRYFGINDCSLAVVNYSFKKKDTGRSINRYYIDGVMSSQGYYYKFIFPMQFDNLYTMYLQLNEESLQNVFRMTLEFHMAFWGEVIFNQQVDIDTGAELGVTFTQENLDEILKYPPIITYGILSQILVTCYDKINYGCSDVGQYKRILELLEDLLANKIKNFQHNAPNIDFDKILEQVQLSMLTTLENYFFNSQVSILNNYPTIPEHMIKQAEEEKLRTEIENQQVQQKTVHKKSLQEMLEADDANGDEDDDDKSDSVSSIFSIGMSNLKHKRLLMSPTFNKQDFRYLSQIQNQELQAEHLQVLVYIHKTCKQIIQTFNANSVYGQICLLYTQNSLDYLTQIVTSEINRQQKLKNSKKINKQTETGFQGNNNDKAQEKSQKGLQRGQTFGLFRMQSEAFMASGDLYDSMLYYKLNSLTMPALMIQPKFYICTATEYIDQLNTTFKDIPGLICQKMFLYDDVIIVLPKGYQLGQKFYNFINDILCTALQTNATYLDVSSERLKHRLDLFKDQNCLLILANYNSITPENMSKISEFCLDAGQQKRKCKVIHLLQSALINQIAQNLLDAHGQYCVQQINQQDQTNNIVYMSQFNYVCQAQAITFKLTQHFHQTIICQEILTAIFSTNNASFQPQILAQLIKNKFPDKNDVIQQLINDIFDGQIEIDYKNQLFIYQALTLFDRIKYNNSGKPPSQQSKDERLNKYISRLLFLEDDIIQKSMFTQLGFQYLTEVLYLLLELNIEKLGIYDADMTYIVIQQFDYLFRNLIQQQIDLQYVLIQDADDVKYYDNGEFIINNQTFYFIVYDKLINTVKYRNVIQNFLLQPKPSNVFIFVYSNDQDFLDGNVQYDQPINSTDGIIDIPAFIKLNLYQSIYVDVQTVSINDIMAKKSSLTITEFDYLINNFNIDVIRIQRIQWMQDFVILAISELFVYCTNVLFGISNLKHIIEVIEIFLSELQIVEFLEIQPKTLSNETNIFPVKIKQYKFQLRRIFYVMLALTQTTGFSYSFLLNLIGHAAFTACYLHYFAGNKEQNIKQQSMLLQNYKQLVSQLMYENKAKITPQFQKFLDYMESKKVDMDEFVQQQLKTFGPINQQIRNQQFQTNKFKFFQFKQIPESLFPLNKVLLNQKNQQILSATNEITQQKFNYMIYYDYLPLIDTFGDVQFDDDENVNPEEEQKDVFLTQQDEIPNRVRYIYKTMLQKGIKPEYMETMAVQTHLLYTAINFSKPSQLINSNNYLTELIIENTTISQMVGRMSYINHKSMYYNRPNVDFRRVSYIIQNQNDINTMFNSIRPFFELDDSLGIAQFSPFTSIRLYISSQLTRDQISQLEYFAVSNVLTCVSDYGQERNYKTQNVITIFIGENKFINNDHVNLIDFRQYEGDEQNFSDLYAENLNKFYGKEISAVENITPHLGQSIDIYKQPFFEACSVGIQQLNHIQKEDYLMRQLLNLYNFNSFCQYKNSLIQYLFKDVSRATYPDSYKANFEKFIKNDRQIKYDFNKDLMADAQKLSFIQLLPGTLSLHMPISITLITRPTISYDAFVQNLQMISRSTTNMMQDMSKQTSLKTLCIDFFSLAWQASNYRYSNKQVFSNMAHQSTETQIYMCFKNIICQCLRLQKLIQTEKVGSDKNVFSNTSSIWSINYHGQNINFDASRVSQFLKSSYFYQYLLVFPISMLFRFNIMSQILQLAFPDNDINHFFSYNNLSDVQVEAAGYMGYDYVNIQCLNMLLSQRIQIYVYDDVGYCQNPKSVIPCHVNVVQLKYIECQSQLLFQEAINIKIIKQLYTQSDSVMQATLQAFQDFTLSDQKVEITENVKLNHILYLIFQDLNSLGDVAKTINPSHLIRCSRRLCAVFEMRCGKHLETVNALFKKANFLIMLFSNMAEEQRQVITQIDQLQLYNQNLDKEIQQQVDEQQRLQKEITVMQQQNPIQSVYNTVLTQITQEKLNSRNKVTQISGQIRELSKRITVKEAPELKAEQLYVLQMLLNTYNQGQNFDNYNDNYKAVTKQQYVAQTLLTIGPELVSGYFTQTLSTINLDGFQLQQKLKLQDAVQKCASEKLEMDTGNAYINLLLQLVKEIYHYIYDNNPVILELYKKRTELQKELDQFNTEIQKRQTAIQWAKNKHASLQKQKADGQANYTSAISMRDQALKRQALVDVLSPRVYTQSEAAKFATIGQRVILRLKEWTSAFLALFLLGGYDLMKTILDKYVHLGAEITSAQSEGENQSTDPTIENYNAAPSVLPQVTTNLKSSGNDDVGICIICQRHQLECCKICQKCTCLCTCHYEFDKFQQEKLIKDNNDGLIPHQRINHYLQSKQSVNFFMQQFNLRPENNKLLSYFINSHDNSDIQEMNSLIFLATCFNNEVLLVSRKNYQGIIDILCASDTGGRGEVVEYINYDQHNFISFQDTILKFLQRDKPCTVVIQAKRMTHDLLFIINKLVSVNLNIEIGNTQFSLLLATTMFKVSSTTKKIRYYLVLEQQQFPRVQIMNNIVNNALTIHNNKYMPYDRLMFNQSEFMDDSQALQEIIKQQKQHLQRTIVYMHYTQLPKEMAQVLYEANMYQLSRIKQLSQLSAVVQDVDQENINTQLTAIKAESDEYENNLMNMEKQKDRYTKLFQQYSSHLNSQEVQMEVESYYQACIQLSRFAIYYPQVINILAQTKNAFDNDLSEYEKNLDGSQGISQQIVERNSMDMLALILQLTQTKLQYKLSKSVLDQLLVYTIYLQAFYQQNLSEDDYRFVIFCFANIGKRNVKEILKQFQSEFCQQMLSWTSKYSTEFETISQQQNLVKYIKTYYKQNLLPECLQNFNLKTLCMTFAIQLVCNNQQALDQQCQQLLEFISPKHVQQNVKFKEVVLHIKQLLKGSQKQNVQEGEENVVQQMQTVIVMTADGKIVTQIIKSLIDEVTIKVIQGLKEIDFQAENTVYLISSKQQHLYNQEFFDIYYQNLKNIFMVNTDGYSYEYDDTIAVEDNQDDEELSEETSGFRTIQQQVMKALPQLVTQYNRNYGDQNIKIAHLYFNYSQRLRALQEHAYNMNNLLNDYQQFITQVKKSNFDNQLQFMKKFNALPLALQNIFSVGVMFAPLDEMQLVQQIVNNRVSMAGNEVLIRSTFKYANSYLKNLLVMLKYKQSFQPIKQENLYKVDNPFNQTAFQTYVKQPKLLPFVFERAQLNEFICLDDKKPSSGEYIKCVHDNSQVYLQKGNAGNQNAIIKQDSMHINVNSKEKTDYYFEEAIQQ